MKLVPGSVGCVHLNCTSSSFSKHVNQIERLSFGYRLFLLSKFDNGKANVVAGHLIRYFSWPFYAENILFSLIGLSYVPTASV